MTMVMIKIKIVWNLSQFFLLKATATNALPPNQLSFDDIDNDADGDDDDGEPEEKEYEDDYVVLGSDLSSHGNLLLPGSEIQGESKNMNSKQALNDSTHLTSSKSIVATEANRGVVMFFQKILLNATRRKSSRKVQITAVMNVKETPQ